jgi:hypothetical protein
MAVAEKDVCGGEAHGGGRAHGDGGREMEGGDRRRGAAPEGRRPEVEDGDQLPEERWPELHLNCSSMPAGCGWTAAVAPRERRL